MGILAMSLTVAILLALGVTSANGDAECHVTKSQLLFGCADTNEVDDDYICCHNTMWAEPSGFFQTVGGDGGLFAQLEPTGVTNFYDSSCNTLLFRAPVGRSFEDWRTESEHHGWPSFRDEEVVWDNVRVLEDGETVSIDGTHLGHNLPDLSGNRYCINLVSVAGKPEIEV